MLHKHFPLPKIPSFYFSMCQTSADPSRCRFLLLQWPCKSPGLLEPQHPLHITVEEKATNSGSAVRSPWSPPLHLLWGDRNSWTWNTEHHQQYGFPELLRGWRPCGFMWQGPFLGDDGLERRLEKDQRGCGQEGGWAECQRWEWRGTQLQSGEGVQWEVNGKNGVQSMDERSSFFPIAMLSEDLKKRDFKDTNLSRVGQGDRMKTNELRITGMSYRRSCAGGGTAHWIIQVTSMHQWCSIS